MSKKTKLGVASVVGIALAIILTLAAMRSGTKAVNVRIEPVQKRDLIASVTASGNVTPHTKVDLSSDITGKIVRLDVKEGQIVSKGQFLLQIDPQEAQANVQRAEAALSAAKASSAQAKASLIQAQKSYERSLEIKKTNAQLISDEQLEQLRTTVDVDQAVFESQNHLVDQNAAQLAQVKSALGKTTIYAPMAGRVTRLNVEGGETAIMGTLNKDAETRPDFSATAKIVTDSRRNVLSIPIIALTVRENETIQSGDTAIGLGKPKPKKEVGKKDVEGVFVVAKDNKVTFRPVRRGITG